MIQSRALLKCVRSVSLIRLADTLRGAPMKWNAKHCQRKCQHWKLYGW